MQHYRHYSEHEETIFKLIGGAPATTQFLEEPPQLSATEEYGIGTNYLTVLKLFQFEHEDFMTNTFVLLPTQMT